MFQLILPFQLELPFEEPGPARVGAQGAARVRRARVRGRKARALPELAETPLGSPADLRSPA